MINYIIKRIAYAILAIFLVSSITFGLMHLVPGGPFLSEKAVSDEQLNALNEKYGLDQPTIIQYKNYMVKLVQGDLGTSLKKRGMTVNEIIGKGFPISMKVGAAAVIIALLIGIPLGSIAALKRGKLADNIIIVLATCGIAIPSFVLATVLMYYLSVVLKWFPTFGLSSPLHMVLPVISLAFYPTAYISRLMRSSMLDVLGQDYMVTARAKGLSQFKSLFKHALRNAVIPVITYVGPLFASIITGSFVVEKIFTIPGLGKEFIASITGRDYPLIMGTTIFLAFLIIMMNVLVDIAYKIVDPRIKLK